VSVQKYPIFRLRVKNRGGFLLEGKKIRETYSGPLSMAIDMMVWNITKDKINERMAISTDDAWSVPGTARQPSPEKGMPDPSTDEIGKGRWLAGFQAQDEMLDEFMKKWIGDLPCMGSYRKT